MNLIIFLNKNLLKNMSYRFYDQNYNKKFNPYIRDTSFTNRIGSSSLQYRNIGETGLFNNDNIFKGRTEGIYSNSKTTVNPKSGYIYDPYKWKYLPSSYNSSYNRIISSTNPYLENYSYKYNNDFQKPRPQSEQIISNNVLPLSYNIDNKYYATNNANNNYYGELNAIINSKVGLSNLGNTCFMNTCLQILIHSEDFIRRLLEKQDIIKNNFYMTITLKFLNLCKEMGVSQIKQSISPSDFKQKFGSKHSLFSGYGQNDTQEFCRVLLEDMNIELNEVKNKQPYRELSTFNKPKLICDKEFDDLFRSRESSIVMDSFYGQIINIFTCTCQNKDYSFQKVLDLPLLLKSENSNNIYELLNYYFGGESIQFETKCPFCGQKTIHRKEIKFSHPPNILILTLQRFGRNQRKNNCIVKIEEELNIRNYIDEECGHGKEYSYSLYGIGNHSGTINFGHYFAYIKLNDRNWYEFNDSTVYRIGNINTNSSTAYTLFYKKNI